VTVLLNPLLVIVGAQLPAGAQHINACAGPNGQLRLVGSSADCRNNEHFLTWSLQGPKGDKGDKGDTGATGTQGSQGQNAGLSGEEVTFSCNTITSGNPTGPTVGAQDVTKTVGATLFFNGVGTRPASHSEYRVTAVG
jgi:hypothetical protein